MDEPSPPDGSEKLPPPQFGTVKRGLDGEAVDAFVAQVALAITTLEGQLREIRSRPAIAASDDFPPRQSGFLAMAETQAAKLVSEAKVEADEVAAGSRIEAERIIADAQDEADRAVEASDAFLQKAKEDSDRARSELTERRRAMLEDLEAMRSRLLGLLPDIERVLDRSGAKDGSPPSASGEPPPDK